MGEGISLECKHCGYNGQFLLGIGMMFPIRYEEIVEEIISGKYGDEWKQFFDANKGAAVVIDETLYQCDDCNELISEPELTLYLHEENEPPLNGYWASWCDGENYKFVKEYLHKCHKCKGNMHKIEKPHKEIVTCPKCGKALTEDYMDRLLWD